MRRAALLILALLLTGACSNETEAPSRLVGPIVAIDADGDVARGFTLEARGQEWEILMDPELDYGIDLIHLQEHLDQSLPVAVRLEERGGDLYALSIDDI